MTELTPDEVILRPEDYDVPSCYTGEHRKHLDRNKQPVKVTRQQITFFGERGVPWKDIERFYGVARVTLMRHYKADYDKGQANTNIALRNKMVQMALAGNVPILIFTAKNRLFMSDNGVTQDAETDEDLKTKSTEELVDFVKKNYIKQ